MSIAGRMGLAARLRAYFLAGVLVTAPIGITLYLSWLFVTFIDDRVASLLPPRFNPETYLPFSVPGLGVVTVVVLLILVGSVTAGLLGRTLLRISEGIVNRIPAVRHVYAATKQILETILANQSKAFREVVLIEYPRRGIWAVGFITGPTEGEVQNLSEDTLINIFVPTTPNPTSGFLLFIPKAELIVLNMSIEEGIKMVVSAGILTPPDRHPEGAERPFRIASRRDDRGDDSPTVVRSETRPRTGRTTTGRST